MRVFIYAALALTATRPSSGAEEPSWITLWHGQPAPNKSFSFGSICMTHMIPMTRLRPIRNATLRSLMTERLPMSTPVSAKLLDAQRSVPL